MNLWSIKSANILICCMVILLLILYAINMGNTNSITTGKFNNGMQWVTVDNPNVDSATVALYVKVGHQDENPSTYGMAHYLEHMLYKGTKKRDDEVTTEIERDGGRFNGHTEMNYTVYWYTITRNKILKAFDVRDNMIQLDKKSILKMCKLFNVMKYLIYLGLFTTITPEESIKKRRHSLNIASKSRKRRNSMQNNDKNGGMTDALALAVGSIKLSNQEDDGARPTTPTQYFVSSYPTISNAVISSFFI